MHRRHFLRSGISLASAPWLLSALSHESTLFAAHRECAGSLTNWIKIEVGSGHTSIRARAVEILKIMDPVVYEGLDTGRLTDFMNSDIDSAPAGTKKFELWGYFENPNSPAPEKMHMFIGLRWGTYGGATAKRNNPRLRMVGLSDRYFPRLKHPRGLQHLRARHRQHLRELLHDASCKIFGVLEKLLQEEKGGNPEDRSDDKHVNVVLPANIRSERLRILADRARMRAMHDVQKPPHIEECQCLDGSAVWRVELPAEGP